MDSNNFYFSCVGCKYAMVNIEEMRIYCTKRNRYLTIDEYSNYDCELKEGYFILDEDDEHLSFRFEVI